MCLNILTHMYNKDLQVSSQTVLTCILGHALVFEEQLHFTASKIVCRRRHCRRCLLLVSLCFSLCVHSRISIQEETAMISNPHHDLCLTPLLFFYKQWGVSTAD